jgi:CheY-like chemotaxis protein
MKSALGSNPKRSPKGNTSETLSPIPLLAVTKGVTINIVILVVEDDVISRAYFADTLRAYGYEVMEAGDGIQALALLARNHCELVITDMVLPHLNGLNLVARIQQIWPKLPVIMVSGYLSENAGRNIFDGKVDCFTKPVRPSALVAMVQRLVPRSTAH